MDKDGIIIVDMDGTICDSSKRLQKIGFDPSKPMEEWPTDWGDHMEDEPIYPIINIVEGLSKRYYIWIVTIRHPVPSNDQWLQKHNIQYDRFFQLGRPYDIGTDPAFIKRKWLHSLPSYERDMLVMAIEDSPSMIRMFREEGLRCIDVGQFEGSMN